MTQTNFPTNYKTLLAKSQAVNWTVDEVLGCRELNFKKPFLPESLAGTAELTFLNTQEKLLLNHIRAYSYAHMFRYVEGFIVPEIVKQAQQHVAKDEDALAALLNFCSEELKHRALFSELMQRFNGTAIADAPLLGKQENLQALLDELNPLAPLLLTLCIEVFTQVHYLEAFRTDVTLDPIYSDVFRSHWLVETFHAQLDTLEILALAKCMNDRQISDAMTDLGTLLTAYNTLLCEQAQLDIATFEDNLPQRLSRNNRSEIERVQIRSFQWTFLVSGLEHKQFQNVVQQLFNSVDQNRLKQCIADLSTVI